MAKRAKPGDVLAINTSHGMIYVHFLGVHREYGDCVAVSPRPVPETVSIDQNLFRHGFVVFYPARGVVQHGLATIVGELPSQGVPRRLRRPGRRVGKRIETWVIEEESQERATRLLSDEERQLPLAIIWNHEFLVQRVLEGWRPEDEGVNEEEPVGPPVQSSTRMNCDASELSHYLYFPRQEAANSVAKILRSRGFSTEERLGADGTNWLVLATRPNAVSCDEDIADIRSMMEGLSEEHGGEYDGWEAKPHSPK